jgi:hypothetical protein
VRGSPTAAVLVALALVAGSGCARTTAPTGGEVPETPPAVISVSPDTFAVVEPFDGPVRIEFERRISERPTTGSLRDAVLVSPRTGEVEVRHRRRGLEVRMEGGFQERTVYRITLQPTLQDLFRNRLDRPQDFFFSTGPDFEPNLVAGLLVDRLTGQPVPRARVDARPHPEGAVHSAASDSLGVFAFRFLPAGRYLLVAYEDRNRNREPDFEEPQDSIQLEFALGDTLVVTELALLQPDTTAAVLMGVRLVDSVTVEASFDDHLDPELPLTGVTARLEREDGPGIQVTEILHRWEWEAREAERAPPEPDPEPGDPEPGEDPPDPEDPAAAPPLPGDPAEAPEAQEDTGPPLPAQDIVLFLASPVEPGATYLLVVEGVRNLHGIPDGGGELEMEIPEPPPPPEPDAAPGEPGDEDPEEDPEEDPPPPVPTDTLGLGNRSAGGGSP